MGNVYSVDTQKNLILYGCGQYIYLRMAIGESLDRPIILCNDYENHLFDTIYKNTLHYSYMNTNKDIVVKSTLDTGTLYKLSAKDIPDCINCGLTVFNDTLLLLYLVKNPLDDTFILKCISPVKPDYAVSIPMIFSEIPNVKTFSCEHMLYIIISEQGTSVWSITPDLTLHRYNESFDKESIENEISSRYTDELNRRELIIMQQNDIIESIKKQYNDLMETATKYRDEAIKWRSKFIQ